MSSLCRGDFLTDLPTALVTGEGRAGYVLLYHFLIQIFFYATDFSRKLLGKGMHGSEIESLTIRNIYTINYGCYFVVPA